MKPLPIEDLEHVLINSKRVFESLRNAKIFITGGTGFFGVWLLESLLYANANIEITVLTRDAKKFQAQFSHITSDNLQFIEGDVRDFIFPNKKFTHIIHAATDASLKLNVDNPTKMVDVILQGTKRILDFALQCGAKNILLVSSGAVYGRQPPEISHISEDYTGSPDIQNPAWAYGIGKRTAEHIAMLYAHQYKLNIKIARCFAFVGPHLPLDTHFAIGNFLRDVLAQKDIAILGDGTPYRSYQYAADLVIWLLHILCFGENNIPYNVGSDEAISIRETAEIILQFSPTLKLTIAKTADSTVLPERYVPSVTRAKKSLNLENKIILKDAIARTLKWLEQ